MSPRRSSRARTTQPPPSAPAHSTSSSSVSSARTERATRSNNKQSSPQKSSTPHSLSSEDVDDPNQTSLPEPPLTRRRTREQDNDEDDDNKLDEELDDDLAEEEEITRCICGHQEYPGPPDTGKSKDSQSSALTDPDLQADDAGGLFIQCDVCKVWQHGGCVGIMEEATCPEEYYCEECRKDLHKVMTSPKGQKYSRYLPVSDQGHSKNSRKGSVSKEPETRPSKDKERNARASVESLTKRRSTMNSRAAYDEDEVLRKVLEESKGDGGLTASENGSRKKRSRDESEDIKQEPKRQRTGSQSPTSSPTLESDEDPPATKGNGRQKPRGAAARSQREKELRDKEREKEKAEAANRRKTRIERRRAEESEVPETTPTVETISAPTIPEPTVADTPPPPPPPAPIPTALPKKTGRPAGKARGSRLGRNQYTRDLPTPTPNGISPREGNETPNSPHLTNGTGNGHESSDGAPGSKSGRTKHWKLEKLSWNEIKRPASAMQNYITQRQVELAGEEKKTPPLQRSVTVNGNNAVGREKEGRSEDKEGDGFEGFKEMSTLQMMDDLNRDLVMWHRMVAEGVVEK